MVVSVLSSPKSIQAAAGRSFDAASMTNFQNSCLKRCFQKKGKLTALNEDYFIQVKLTFTTINVLGKVSVDEVTTPNKFQTRHFRYWETF